MTLNQQPTPVAQTSSRKRLAARPRAPTIVLTITPEIVARAEKRDSSHCLWAEALKEAFPTATKISVDLQTVRFTDPFKGLRYTYLTPRKAQVCLVRYDAGLHTEAGLTVTLREGQVSKAANHQVRRDHGSPDMPEGRKREIHQRERGVVPAVVGGKPPPTGALNAHYGAKRRQFGIRALEL